MEKIVDFIKSIIDRPIADLVILLATLYMCGLLSSCQTLTPMIQDNRLGAEGVVQKEKTLNRQVKWYFKPEEND